MSVLNCGISFGKYDESRIIKLKIWDYEPLNWMCHYNVMSFFSKTEIYLRFTTNTLLIHSLQNDLENKFHIIRQRVLKSFSSIWIMCVLNDVWNVIRWETNIEYQTETRVCYKSIEPKNPFALYSLIGNISFTQLDASRRIQRAWIWALSVCGSLQEKCLYIFRRVNRLGDLMFHELNIFSCFFQS